MWMWVLAAYLVMLMALVGSAGFVALFVRQERRANRAYRVLRVAGGLTTCGTGVTAVILRVSELTGGWG